LRPSPRSRRRGGGPGRADGIGAAAVVGPPPRSGFSRGRAVRGLVLEAPAAGDVPPPHAGRHAGAGRDAGHRIGGEAAGSAGRALRRRPHRRPRQDPARQPVVGGRRSGEAARPGSGGMVVGTAASRLFRTPALDGAGGGDASAPRRRARTKGRQQLHHQQQQLSHLRFSGDLRGDVPDGAGRRQLGRLLDAECARAVGRSGEPALPRPVRKLGAGGVCPDALQSRGDRGGGREAHSPGPAPGVTEARVPASGSTSASAARGVACMVGGSALITLNDSIIKSLGGIYPVGEMLFVRCLFTLIPVAYFAWRAGGLASLRVNDWTGQAIRAVAVVSSAFCFVYGLTLLPLAGI